MAIVLPAVGVVPLAVDPPDHCPVQMEQEQYPVSLNLPRYVSLEELLEVSDADGLPVVVEDALLSEELLPELLLVSVSAFAAAFAASAAATYIIGFVYAPEMKKKILIKQLEAAISTIK